MHDPNPTYLELKVQHQNYVVFQTSHIHRTAHQNHYFQWTIVGPQLKILKPTMHEPYIKSPFLQIIDFILIRVTDRHTNVYWHLLFFSSSQATNF